MITSHLGELFALLTAFFWTTTSLSFQQATRRSGVLSVNVLRLIIAFVIYALISYFSRGMFLPFDASTHQWIWMSLSGIVGFVFGDYFLLKSYEFISARISMLLMSLSAPIAALISWVFLGESMSFISLFAMFITIFGIIIVITEKKKLDTEKLGSKNKKLQFSFSPKGMLFAFFGSLGQALGLVLSKYGMQDYNVFAATQIRIIASSIGFVILITLIKRWPKVKQTVKDSISIKFILIGSVFGPFLGVYTSLLSVKYTSVGIASTIMAIIPVLIIPPAILIYKEKVTLKEVIGAFIALGGIAVFFIQ
ncbi:DMT family transporter [Lutibacter sp.]|uniref:DMT family transporter n=1 Tax=Lutibacter sp. TaxID=1925666 RepID=UPI0025BB6D45|nr:DMT family transporter [Lutibacter sp.]MCF6166946.1 DMT family transporter [Lutibacter sp.]